MSQQFGPKIRTDNLVLCLDAYDYKSYQGEPTTNLLSNGDFENNSTSGWSFDAKTDGSWSVISSDKKHGSYCAKLINSTIQTIALWQGFSMNTGETYTVSCWIKNVNCPTTPFFNVTNATFDENSLTTITTGVTAGSEWTYVSKTFTTNATGTCNPYIRTSSNSLQGHFLIDDFQVEQKGYATPFVNGTRSTTSTWKDRTMYGNDGDFASTTATRTLHYRNKNVIYPSQNAYIDFNGTSDYVSLISVVDLAAATTIIVWFNADDVTSSSVLYGPSTNGADNWFSVVSSKLRIFATETADTNNFSLDGVTILSTGTWYQGVAVLNGNVAKLYLNGELENSVTKSFIIGKWNGVANIGARSTGVSNFYNGKIARVTGYNRELSVEEIRNDYRMLKGRFGL